MLKDLFSHMITRHGLGSQWEGRTTTDNKSRGGCKSTWCKTKTKTVGMEKIKLTQQIQD